MASIISTYPRSTNEVEGCERGRRSKTTNTPKEYLQRERDNTSIVATAYRPAMKNCPAGQGKAAALPKRVRLSREVETE
jgi:hypothetical protein